MRWSAIVQRQSSILHALSTLTHHFSAALKKRLPGFPRYWQSAKFLHCRGELEAFSEERGMSTGCTLWFTGLSGSGKSTLSQLVAARLRGLGAKVEVLDGDITRTLLCQGLGFSREDREENIRRIGFVCELLSRNGVIAIAAAISPYRASRQEVRGRLENFMEIY